MIFGVLNNIFNNSKSGVLNYIRKPKSGVLNNICRNPESGVS